MKYGMPYQGSKNSVAEWIVETLPAADILVDAFGGGGAVTHCASLSGKWNKVIYNEIEPMIVKGFRMAVNGQFKAENRWVSREMFNLLKDTDPYVALCFSFGNNPDKGYCYSAELEPIKKALHYSILGNTPKERRLAFRKLIQANTDGNVINLESLERLQNLERLERLQNLERLEIEIRQGSYTDLEIPQGAVVYCDIPYKNTAGYLRHFDRNEFYRWALNQPGYVFISEYEMPGDFYLVAETDRVSLMETKEERQVVKERIYCNRPYRVQSHRQLSLLETAGL